MDAKFIGFVELLAFIEFVGFFELVWSVVSSSVALLGHPLSLCTTVYVMLFALCSLLCAVADLRLLIADI